MFFLISFFWLIRETKSVLFWLYLWQLKEYHLGRFLDHFRTEKGKKLLLNPLNFLKIIFVFIFPFFVLFLPYFLTLVYFGESAAAFKKFLQKKLKRPVLTKKTVFLILAGILLEIFFLLAMNGMRYFAFVFWLLVFDIFTPAIVSGIVLLFQPWAVLGRNQIVKKAKRKRAQVDELRSSSPSLGSPCAPRSVFKDLLVIGITGSYGKTSTKEFLYTILSQKFNVLKTKEHQNSEVGISQCILQELKPEHEIFICEMGAYNRGGIKLLCDIAKPKFGILTGINEQHMATFGSQENIIKTKFELIESLPEDGIAFFNAKNKYCLELYERTKIRKKLYGEDIKLAGMENIEGAKAIARELGLSEEEILRGCQKIENKFGGIEIRKGINDLNVIDATYSANPDGVISHLEYLKTWPGRKIIIMPCLIELGKLSKGVHKRIGQKIAEVCDLAIITTKDRFKEIKEGAISHESGARGVEILFLENPKEIFEKIKEFCQPGDIILLESRVPSQLIQQLTINN